MKVWSSETVRRQREFATPEKISRRLSPPRGNSVFSRGMLFSFFSNTPAKSGKIRSDLPLDPVLSKTRTSVRAAPLKGIGMPFFLGLLFLMGLLPASPLSAKDITRPEEMMEGVDKNVLKELRANRNGDEPSNDALKKADEQLQAYGGGKTGSFRIRVTGVETDDKGTLLLVSSSAREQVSGLSMEVTHTILLDPSQKEKAGRIKPGDRITATGTPWAALSWSKKFGYRFSFCLDKASLK